MARAFLTADVVNHNAKHVSLLMDAFENRLILLRADAEAHLESLRNLPRINLPQVMNNTLSAAMYLENELQSALNLPADHNLLPLSCYRNSREQAYITYFSSQSVLLEGEEFGNFEGTSLELFGGLTLMFDANDKLRSVVYRPVTEEDIRQIKIIMAEFIRFRRITRDIHDTNEVPQPIPQGLYLTADETPSPEGSKVVRYPVMFDDVPDDIEDLRSYLQHWQKGNPQ